MLKHAIDSYFAVAKNYYILKVCEQQQNNHNQNERRKFYANMFLLCLAKNTG